MPLINAKVRMRPGAAEEIGQKMGYDPRHVRYVALRERPGSIELIDEIKANKAKSTNKRIGKLAA